MKSIKHGAATLGALLLAVNAQAASLQYQLTGTFSEIHKYNTAFPPTELEIMPGDQLALSSDATISATFTYDPNQELAWSGIHNPAISSLTLTVNGTTLSAPGLYSTAYNDEPYFAPNDVVLHDFAPPASYMINGFYLSQITLRVIGPSDYLTGVDLPADLENGLSKVQLVMLFGAPDRPEGQFVTFDTTVTPVPLPASGLLFGTSLIGLAVKLRRNAQRAA